MNSLIKEKGMIILISAIFIALFALIPTINAMFNEMAMRIVETLG
jgi:hypothetical protein